MRTLTSQINSLDWQQLNDELLANGFVVTRPFLSAGLCAQIQKFYKDDALFRSTIDMKRHNYGKGVYRYFKYPLPPLIQLLRETLYEKIVGTANSWAERLRLEIRYPKKFSAFQKQMRDNDQTRPTPLILRYEAGDFNCLHQDINNDIVFPYQSVFGLCEKDRDYAGGQLILTQQRPRMQTIPYIISVPKGAAVLFTSNFHPQQGARGFHRTVFKHGVGKIESGERYTMGIVFHDYRS